MEDSKTKTIVLITAIIVLGTLIAVAEKKACASEVMVKGAHHALISQLKPEMKPAVEAAKLWRQSEGFDTVVITSTTKGKHKNGSKHYLGLALDLRIRDLTPRQKTSYYKYLKTTLEGTYEVYFSSDHIHVEYAD